MGADTSGFSKWQSVAVTRHARLLEAGTAYRFRDWPTQALPAVAAGAYTLWESGRLLYVDGARGNRTASDTARHRRTGLNSGLYESLQAHASGRRHENPFCAALWDRLLRPKLSRADHEALSIDCLSPEAAIKAFVTERCCYRFEVLDDGPLIHWVVTRVRQGCLKAGKPLFNPLPENT